MAKRAIPLCVILMVLMIEHCCSADGSCPAGRGYSGGNVGQGGSYTSCNPCRAGFYSPGGTSSCLKCAVGHFQDKREQATCKKCAVNSYQPQRGEASCVDCPNGLFTQNKGEAGNGACVTALYLLTLREGKTYDCVNDMCNPLPTPGLRAYPTYVKNLFVGCPPMPNGRNKCVIRRCPGGTEFDPRPELLRCFSYTEFDCVNRDPCHLAGGTGQYKYAYLQNNRKYVNCGYRRDWTLKCAVKDCTSGIFDIPAQKCIS